MARQFGLTPQVRFNRSKFDLSHKIQTTFNVGNLVPLDWQEVIPGDTFAGKLKGVIRVSSSFIKPVIDNMYMDAHHFFIPYRLCYKDTERVFGNPNPSAYVDNDLKEFPTNTKACIVVSGSVGEYLGLPLGTYPAGTINLMPFRAFALVYNQWFRNENVIDEIYVQNGEAVDSENPNANVWSPNNYCGMLPKVMRRKDYFSTCLPAPQKGQAVGIPVAGGNAPVTGLINAPVQADSVAQNLSDELPLQITNGNSTQPLSMMGVVADNTAYGLLGHYGDPIVGTGTYAYLDISPLKVVGSLSNGQADLSEVTFANVNDLRYAFALQKMLERDALYGSRYNEFLLGHFGVSSPDARLQFTEYLGGGRIPIQIYQAVQTSQATEDSPLGNVAGFSVSEGQTRFVKGFTEHGICLTVASVRQFHTYQQGLPKKWTKKAREDYYDPLFATIGEQPIYQSELYYNGGDPKANIFGYNEAFADYRSLPNIITGELRSNIDNSLDVWHFGDYYSNGPTLSDTFIEETTAFVDRTLSVPSTSQDTFIFDGWFELPAIRVMPTYSVPGLIDHH